MIGNELTVIVWELTTSINGKDKSKAKVKALTQAIKGYQV